VTNPQTMNSYHVFGGVLRSELAFPELDVAERGDPDWTLTVTFTPAPDVPLGPQLGEDRVDVDVLVHSYATPSGFRLVYDDTGVFDVSEGGRAIRWHRPPSADLEAGRLDVLGRVLALAELRGLVGREVSISDWLVVTQERINAFADTTDDHQWIHVDVERATAETPFGTTIAHGFLTLSLLSGLMRNAVTIDGPRMTLNYGFNRVRFVSPVPSGSRIRARVVLGRLDDLADSTQVTWNVTVVPVCAKQITGVDPTGKNDPDCGLQLIAGMVSPFSPVVVVPQKPVPVGVL